MAPMGFENPGSGDVQVKMLRNTVVDGKDVKKGDVVTTSKREAHQLVREGDAARIEKPAADPVEKPKGKKGEKPAAE
jgi:hypothetical protein